MTEPIPQHVLAAAGRAFRFQVLSELNRALAHSGLTFQQVAARLDANPRHVRNLLTGRRELTLRDIGMLFFAIDGSMMDLTIKARSR